MSTDQRITTPFAFESTAAQVIDGIDLAGKRAVVTGGASGIGVETVRALASAGADVTIAARDTAAGEAVAADITRTTGNAAVHVGRLDLADQASVVAFAKAWDGPLDLLINNAGIMALPERRLGVLGQELQFETNHLGHFALALGLHGALAKADGGARIVSLSSRGHQRSDVIFDDLTFDGRDYDPWLAYGQSKTANVLFAVEATRRWAGDGIVANAVHPGAISATSLSRHMDPAAFQAALAAVAAHDKTIEQGAATSVLVATTALLEGIGGRYFEDCNEAVLIEDGQPNNRGGLMPYAVDPASAERLWDLSESLVA